MPTVVPILSRFYYFIKRVFFWFRNSFVVNRNMFTSGHNFKITNSIIRPILISMMNNLIGFKSTIKMFFHYMTMLKNFFSIDIKNSIAICHKNMVIYFKRRINFSILSPSKIMPYAISSCFVFLSTIFNCAYKVISFHNDSIKRLNLNVNIQ